MRRVLVLTLFLAACTNQPNAATSPTPSPSAAASRASTPTASLTPSPAPIALPTIAQLSAPSGPVVWALVGGTRLFRSSDRGDTWVERSIPPGLASTEASFADATNGLLLNAGTASGACETQTVSIGKTVDGAATWQQVKATGIADAMCKRGLVSADSTHVFLMAYGPNSGPVIYRTADGGLTWAPSRPLPDPPGFTFTQPGGVVILPGRPRALGSVVLVEAQGYGEKTRFIFRSADGGATWTYASTVPTFEGSVAFVTPTRWVEIAPPGSSKETTDAGASWHAYTTDYSQAAPIAGEFVFGDAMVGYATVRGSIQRTTDGGAHWTAIKTPGTG